MTRLEKTILIISLGLSVVLLVVLLNFSIIALADQNDNTNVSSSSGDFWAWNDVIGWIDNHNTHTVLLSGTTLKGYASSSAGDITYDCATARGGSLCGSSNFKVSHDGEGNLEGWGWNNLYGWISFCGGQGTANCPGSINYKVQVDLATGIFKGDGDDYAWNDAVGWISFNCLNHDFPTCDYNYRVVIGAATSTAGILESTPFDTRVSGGAQINSIAWKGDLPSGTSVYFQLASSNSESGPWTFTGSDGTGNTYYGPLNPDTSLKVDYSLYNNKRYFKYKVFLYSDPAQLRTPRIDDVLINWSP